MHDAYRVKGVRHQMSKWQELVDIDSRIPDGIVTEGMKGTREGILGEETMVESLLRFIRGLGG